MSNQLFKSCLGVYIRPNSYVSRWTYANYICKNTHTHILILEKKPLSDLKNVNLHFRPIYGTSSLSTDVILTVGLYRSIQKAGKFKKLQNNNYYYDYQSRDFKKASVCLRNSCTWSFTHQIKLFLFIFKQFSIFCSIVYF